MKPSVERIVSGVLAVCFVLAFGLRSQAEETAIVASDASLAAWDYALADSDEAMLDKIQRGCFQYFWQEVGEPAAKK